MQASPDAGSTRTSRIQIPAHVVYRRLPTETVVFNLRTGKYHGLNDTAGDMLEALARTGDMREAASIVAAEYGRPQSVIERDMRALFDGLLKRGLVERDGYTPD